VTAVALYQDGARAATAGEDGALRLWDLAAGRGLAAVRGHAGAVRALAISPRGDRAATAGEDGAACLWELASGACLGRWEGDSPLTTCAFAGDGRLILGDESGGVITLAAGE
jgi:WD40 repeat protein